MKHITKKCPKCGFTVTWDGRRGDHKFCPSCEGDRQKPDWIRPIIQEFAKEVAVQKAAVFLR